MLKEGDSVVFTMSIDTLEKRKALTYNDIFKKGDQIKATMKVVKVFSTETEIRADIDKEVAALKDKEIADLKKYLAKKGINAQQTKNGVFVQIESAGNQSNKVAEGKVASVMYKGYLLEDGKVFDTNMDSTGGPAKPYDVVVGAGRVIPGWDEALPYFAEGGSGKIFIPSMLAYGMQGSPGAIPPFSNLGFDIVVKKVADAPKQAPAAPGTQLTPEQMQALQEEMQRRQQGGQQGGN
jgi:FKBP-type peptidyl-prolyl cis-trans isomerase